MSWERLKDKKLQERLTMRSRIIQMVREFFVKEGFLEVETPILVPFAGQEPYLNPMKVEFTTPNPSSERRGSESISSLFSAQGGSALGGEGDVRRGYLITSPEYAHKKLLAAGFKKTFEITKAFRSGEHFGGLHNPEFTMIEWYRAQADYTAIMADVEKMVRFVKQSVISTKRPEGARGEISHDTSMQGVRSLDSARDDEVELFYQGRTIDLSSPWERLTAAEAFDRYAGVDLNDVPDEETFFKIFLTKIERNLGVTKPTILYDYPAAMASLARIRTTGQQDSRTAPVAERFEVYIAGIELGNAFSELNDAKEQRRRFMEEQALRKKLGKDIIPLDEDFLDAVGQMPPSAGIAFGVDRLVMLLTNAARIEEVLAFPARVLF